MKTKILSVVSALFLALVLVGCAKSKVLSDKSLANFTMVRTLNGSDSYTVEKEDSYYKVTDASGTVHYYIDFGTQTYKYETTSTTTDSYTSNQTAAASTVSHNYATEWSHDAHSHYHACTDEGFTSLRGSEASHTWGNYTVTVNATADADGIMERTCTVCGEIEQVPIPRTGSTYSSDWASDANKHWHQCTESGKTDQTCCEQEHIWNAGVVTKAATYSATGTMTYTCYVCGATKTEEIPKLVHTYSTSWSYNSTNHWHSALESGYTTSVISDSASHTWGEGVEQTDLESTSASGSVKVYKYTCSECGCVKTETIKTYVASEEVDDVELSDYATELKAITNGDVTKAADGVYSFKELEDNAILKPFMNGIYLDGVTELGKAYNRGLVTITSATITYSKKVPSALSIVLSYAGSEYTVLYSFSNVGSTAVKVAQEEYIEKGYSAFFQDNDPVVTLNFKGYGKVKVELFTMTSGDLNATQYFIYLIKNSYYGKAAVDAQPSASVLFGKSSKTPSKTIDNDNDPAVSNVRGTLALVLTTTANSTTSNTSELCLNLKNNASTYDDDGYIPVGGVIEGFYVLDALSGLSADEYANVKVTITIEYNGFVYVEPTFAS